MRIRPRRALGILLLAGAILICALDAILGAGIRRVQSGAFGAFNRIADGRVNAELVVAGSSRAVMHYRPDPLQRATGLSTFNIGRIGARTNVHTGLLRFYLKYNRPPRLLIENADLSTLEIDSNLYGAPQYAPYLYDRELYQALRLRYPQIWKFRYIPIYRYVANDADLQHYEGIKTLLGLQPVERYESGSFPTPWIWTNSFATVKASGKKFEYATEGPGAEDFEAFLSTARSHSIPTIVVFSPMYSEHLAMTNRLEEIRSAFASAARKYGAEFWDFSALEPISSDTRYFFDSTHMNATGATAFSEILGQRLAKWLGEG